MSILVREKAGVSPVSDHQPFFDQLMERKIILPSQLEGWHEQELGCLRYFYLQAVRESEKSGTPFVVQSLRDDYELFRFVVFLMTSEWSVPLLEKDRDTLETIYDPKLLQRELAVSPLSAMNGILQHVYAAHPEAFLSFTVVQQRKIWECLSSVIKEISLPSLQSYIQAYNDPKNKKLGPMILTVAKNRLDSFLKIVEKTITSETLKDVFQGLSNNNAKKDKIVEILDSCFKKLPPLADCNEVQAFYARAQKEVGSKLLKEKANTDRLIDLHEKASHRLQSLHTEIGETKLLPESANQMSQWSKEAKDISSQILQMSQECEVLQKKLPLSFTNPILTCEQLDKQKNDLASFVSYIEGFQNNIKLIVNEIEIFKAEIEELQNKLKLTLGRASPSLRKTPLELLDEFIQTATNDPSQFPALTAHYEEALASAKLELKIFSLIDDYHLLSLVAFLKTGQKLSPLSRMNQSPLGKNYDYEQLNFHLVQIPMSIVVTLLENLYKADPKPFLMRTVEEQQNILGCLEGVMSTYITDSLDSYLEAYSTKVNGCDQWNWDMGQVILNTAKNRLSDLSAIIEKSSETKEALKALFDSSQFANLSEEEQETRLLEVLAPCFKQLPELASFEELAALKMSINTMMKSRFEEKKRIDTLNQGWGEFSNKLNALPPAEVSVQLSQEKVVRIEAALDRLEGVLGKTTDYYEIIGKKWENQNANFPKIPTDHLITKEELAALKSKIENANQ